LIHDLSLSAAITSNLEKPEKDSEKSAGKKNLYVDVAGLFEGAISQSGSALNPRSSIPSARATSRARKLATLLGIPVAGKTDREIVQSLKAVPAKSMARSSEKVLEDDVSNATIVDLLAQFIPRNSSRPSANTYC